MSWPPPNDFVEFIKLVNNDGEEVDFDPESLKDTEETAEKTRFAGHCLIWCRTEAKQNQNQFKNFESVSFKAYLNMHLRFDGKFGYPGGMIDPGETIIQGVEREILEETNLKVKLSSDDFIAAMIKDSNRIKDGKMYEKIKTYFFTKEIDEKSFLEFEENIRKAKDFGVEILGNIRIPLYTFRDIYGFPVFLTNSFAGTAKSQLLLAIYRHKLLTPEEIISAYKVHH